MAPLSTIVLCVGDLAGAGCGPGSGAGQFALGALAGRGRASALTGPGSGVRVLVPVAVWTGDRAVAAPGRTRRRFAHATCPLGCLLFDSAGSRPE